MKVNRLSSLTSGHPTEEDTPANDVLVATNDGGLDVGRVITEPSDV